MYVRTALAVTAALTMSATVPAGDHPAMTPEPHVPSAPPDAATPSPTRNAWIVVRGLDSDRNGRPDRVHIRYRLPNNRTGQVPAIVEASPYLAGGNNVANHDVDVPLYVPQSSVEAAFSSAYEGLLRPQGYAYVYAESIGSGGSTGCPTTGGPEETRAVTAVVRWLTGDARAVDGQGHRVRAGWSTGKVGMIGVSYNGTLANAAASSGVEGLDAIVPISAISSWYDYYRSEGAVRAPGGYQGEDADVLAKYVLTRRHAHVCDGVIRSLVHHQDRLTGDVNRFWAARNYRLDAHRTQAAVLSLHGLSDWNVMSDQTGRWQRALAREGVPRMAWWHRGSHGDPLIFGDAKWRGLLVDWFDHWLKGAHNGVMHRPGSVVALSGRRHWSQPSWPEPGAETASLYPREGGRTSGALRLSPALTGRERVTDDAQFPVARLADQHRSIHRLLYRTVPLSERIVLSGLASVWLEASFDSPASNLSVALVDVAPGGTTRVLSEGWADPQNVDSPHGGTALERGRRYAIKVDLDQVLQQRVAAGHRLGLVVAASDHRFTLRPPAGTHVRLTLSGVSLDLPVVGGIGALHRALHH